MICRSLSRLAIFFLLFAGLAIGLAQKVSAVTDNVQINLEVTTPSGGGTPPPPPPPPEVNGCTDSAATNYNSQATSDDGSCQYPVLVPNVSNFSATYQTASSRVALIWSNPPLADLAAVRLVRQIGSVPAGPSDGLLIYDGTDQIAFDEVISAGETYFYGAFVRNDAGNYSSGAIANVTIPGPPDEEPPPEEEPPDEEPPPGEIPPGETSPDGLSGGGPSSEGEGGGEGGGGEAINPFDLFPSVEDPDPLVKNLNLGDFVFSQPGERPRFFRDGETILVTAGKDLSVRINYDRLPEVLKVIGLTIVDPDNPKRASSFILRISEDKSVYTANVGALWKNGLYPFYISIVNFKNQTVKRLSGKFLVSAGASQTPLAQFSRVVVRTAEPVVTVVGLGVGLSQALVLTGQVNSLYDLYLFLVHFWSLLLRVLGLKRRYRPWGVVYDSVTKRPLDPAYVVVRRGSEEAATAITDLDGRYGFFLPAATYSLIANKTHYRFPSVKLQGRNRDELYEHLYFGEPLETKSDEVINRNIPLDPIAFDWNEFAKQQQGFFILHSRRERRRSLIYNTVFGLGAILALYRLLFAPNWLSVGIAGFYLAVFLLKYVWRARRPIVAVRRATGEPVPFAIIRAFVPGVDQQVKSVVADVLGRFFLLTPPGEYYLTVEEKLPDETYKKIFQSPTLDLKNGVLTKDLIV